MVLSSLRGSQLHSQVAPSSSEVIRPKLVARMMRWGASAGTKICIESGKAPSAAACLGTAAASAITSAATPLAIHGERAAHKLPPWDRPYLDDLATVTIVCCTNPRPMRSDRRYPDRELIDTASRACARLPSKNSCCPTGSP